MPRSLPELMTPEQIQAETGLPRNTVRRLVRRPPRAETGMRRVVVRRADVFATLREDPPLGAGGRRRFG